MIYYDYLWEYFDEYKISNDKKQKNRIKESFIERIFSGEFFTLQESKNIIFGNLYENKFNISKEQKILFIKWCIGKMFENYLDEEEYENKCLEKGLKRVLEISDESLYDQDVLDYRLEKYFCRTIFFELCNNHYKINNPSYFQCKECGGFFLKNKNIKNNRQKYCAVCKKIVKNRQNCMYKKKK